MSDAIIAGNEPQKVALEADKKYAWCACGRSQAQPFCDGSHKVGSMTPTLFSVEEAKDGFICMCKKTANPPYCDGSHKNL